MSAREQPGVQAGGWLSRITDAAATQQTGSPLIGAIPGEGIGPEVVEAALDVLSRLEHAGGAAVQVELGGPIGLAAERTAGGPLPDDVADFCQDVLSRGGAVLTGPGGGRYVYDLRRRLDLFLKLVPVESRCGLADASPLPAESLEGLDLLLVRETLGGIYQGRSEEILDGDGRRAVRHSFEVSEESLRRFLGAAARLASARRGRLTVVVKQGGVPALARLWRSCGSEASAAEGIDCAFVDVDLMAYELVRRPREFDVIAASNLAGDVLGDLTALLIGSRGLSFSGNFSPRGGAVYQTNHGAAYDIADRDLANPIGQILSLAMLLRESLGLEREALAIEDGVRSVWSRGLRTADIADDGSHVLGTREIAERIAEAAAAQLGVLSRAA